MAQNADLPFASTLCGSCSNVCPVKIDIHEQLYKWRQVLVQAGHVSSIKSIGVKSMASVLSSPSFYRTAGKLGRFLMKNTPFMTNNHLNTWYDQREMPEVPKESFREWFIREKGNK